ncbi:hypothetical protein [Methylobacterium pseudosasicola]|uniref:Uncharacterized protein n=1 Tax=Methylobacterium pseudosasicola TaxID=582667 RepID=A0A1I4VJG2_9HYPH|nr:hypothetical protein [Methylobacterium pseudosasicola]SFN01299.1 hypothetical protein SAMN05192568_11047 [Methylobacterium pseudosasicola]
MFTGPEINKLVAATLAASAAATAAAGTDTDAYLVAYKAMLLGLDKVDDDIERARSAAGMKRLAQRRTEGLIS